MYWYWKNKNPLIQQFLDFVLRDHHYWQCLAYAVLGMEARLTMQVMFLKPSTVSLALNFIFYPLLSGDVITPIIDFIGVRQSGTMI